MFDRIKQSAAVQTQVSSSRRSIDQRFEPLDLPTASTCKTMRYPDAGQGWRSLATLPFSVPSG